MPCPLCRAMFIIPKGGLSDLPKNYSVEKLLDLRKLSVPKCAICSQQKNVLKYCVDCKINLCDQCAKIHTTNRSEEHKVVKLEKHPPYPPREPSGNSVVRHCDQHKDETIKMYCLKCKTAVCPHCFIIKHNGHKCSDIFEGDRRFKETNTERYRTNH